jgi:hypothetical protein
MQSLNDWLYALEEASMIRSKKFSVERRGGFAIGRRAGVTKPAIVEKTARYLGEDPSVESD